MAQLSSELLLLSLCSFPCVAVAAIGCVVGSVGDAQRPALLTMANNIICFLFV